MTQHIITKHFSGFSNVSAQYSVGDHWTDEPGTPGTRLYAVDLPDDYTRIFAQNGALVAEKANGEWIVFDEREGMTSTGRTFAVTSVEIPVDPITGQRGL